MSIDACKKCVLLENQRILKGMRGVPSVWEKCCSMHADGKRPLLRKNDVKSDSSIEQAAATEEKEEEERRRNLRRGEREISNER